MAKSVKSDQPVRSLPARPDLRFLKDEAKKRTRKQEFKRLAEAQLTIAREHGFASWPKLKAHIESMQFAPDAWHGGGMYSFEVNLSASGCIPTLGGAGLDNEPMVHLRVPRVGQRSEPTFPAFLICRYLYSDPPLDVRVTIDGFEQPTHLKLDVPDKAIGKKIRAFLERYSYENKGDALSEREHKANWKQIYAVLARDKISHEKLDRGEAVLTRRAIEAIMELCDRTEWHYHENIQSIFREGNVGKADRAFVARWLMKYLKAERDSYSQTGLRIYENTTPEIADELVPLVEDPRCIDRGSLCMALARAKHPRAKEIIASVVEQPRCQFLGLQALARLKAVEHVDTIRRMLHDADPDVRREAKKTLAKLGHPVSAPPPPVHLVKKRGGIPQTLAEWSANLDGAEVEPTLQRLSSCVESGFGETEVAEVIGVVDRMRVEQTRAFRFPIRVRGKESELWVVIFMDDEDSPDMEIHATADLIKAIARAAA